MPSKGLMLPFARGITLCSDYSAGEQQECSEHSKLLGVPAFKVCGD